MSTASWKQHGSVTQQIVLLGAILTLGSLAHIIHRSSRIFLFQQAQCLIYYKSADPSKIDRFFQVDEALCKLGPIQSRLSMIDGMDAFLACLPPLLVLATYRELLARVGLRRLVLLSLFCSAFEVVYAITVFWFHRDWATAAALLSFLFGLIGGGGVVRTIIIVKCIADIAPSESLAKSYNYITAFYSLGSVGGSYVGSLLLSHHVYILNAISICCYILTAGVAVFIPSYLGFEQQAMEDSALITGDEEGDDQNDGSPAASTSYVEFPRGRLLDFKPSLTSILLNSWISSYRSILGLFNAPRPISTVLLIYLLYGLASRTEVLLPQYTSLLLAWPLATVNKVMALKALVSAVILFLLPTVRSSYLQPRMTTAQIDLFITKGSLVTNMIGVIGMGFSAPAGFFILSLCVYTSGIGLADSLVAYGTLILPPGPQVSEFFVWTGLIDTIATLIGAPLWSAVFSIILRSERLALGLPFWISAGLFGAGVAGVMGLQRR